MPATEELRQTLELVTSTVSGIAKGLERVTELHLDVRNKSDSIQDDVDRISAILWGDRNPDSSLLTRLTKLESVLQQSVLQQRELKDDMESFCTRIENRMDQHQHRVDFSNSSKSWKVITLMVTALTGAFTGLVELVKWLAHMPSNQG